MATPPNHESKRSIRTETQPGEPLDIDYSYNEWRQARMQQLEQSYLAACERDFQC